MRARMRLQVQTVLQVRACVQLFSVKLAGSRNAFEHSAPNLQRIMGIEFTKTADDDPLLERLFQETMYPIPSFDTKFHPSVQNRSTLQFIYQFADAAQAQVTAEKGSIAKIVLTA